MHEQCLDARATVGQRGEGGVRRREDGERPVARQRRIEAGGELLYFENLAPGWFARRTQDANPFDGIDAGSKSAPALADLDADGRSGVRGFHLATTYVPPRR